MSLATAADQDATARHIAGYLPDMVALRRDIHRHPELGYQEQRTSDLVAAALAGWGYEVHRGLGGTGVVGTLRAGSGSKVLGIRADMDALPILETTGLDYASQHPGRMHACGHDGHTTTLLTAARCPLPGRDPRLRRHPAPDLPAGRGRPGRCPEDDAGRPL